MAAQHGTDKLKKARELAAKFDRQNNPKVVADMLLLWDTYGYDYTEKAADIIGNMTSDNPRRHVGYMVGIIKKWIKEREKEGEKKEKGEK